jgi:hypothetical protein
MNNIKIKFNKPIKLIIKKKYKKILKQPYIIKNNILKVKIFYKIFHLIHTIHIN